MPADKRAALLEAAESVLTERGLARARVEEITERAGVAKGTFYLYFSSKDDIVAALQAQLWDSLLELCANAAARLQTGDWWQVVDEVVETVVDFDLAHREWHRMVANGWVQPPTEDQAQREDQFVDLLTAAIELGIEHGACHAEDVPMTALLLYRAIEGTAQQLCRDEDPDRDRAVRAIRAFIRKALAPPSLAPPSLTPTPAT